MRVERFSFKELGSEIAVDTPDGPPSFAPMGKKKALPSAPPPPPTFSEEEMKAAERDGYQKGFLDGIEEGRKQAESEQAEIDRKLQQSAEGFAQTLAPLFDDYREMATRMSEHMPKIALAIARKVAGQALSEEAEKVVSELALHYCQTMTTEPKLTITVNDSMADTLTAKIEKIAGNLPAASEIIILHSPDMPPSDCRIEWNQGMMERRTDQLWQQIEQQVENMIVSIRRDTNAQMDALASAIVPKT